MVHHQYEFGELIAVFAYESENYEDFCKYSMYMNQDERNEYSKRLNYYCNGTLVNQKKINEKEFISKRNELVKIWNKANEYIKKDMPMIARTELDNVSRLLNKMPDNSLSMKFKLDINEGLALAYFQIGDYEESIFWLSIINLKSGKNTYPQIANTYAVLYGRSKESNSPDNIQTQYLKDCCNNFKKGIEMGYQNIGLMGNRDIDNQTLVVEKKLKSHKEFYKRVCENNLNLLSRQDAINKLKEAKELLDIEMMTRKEFDKLKEELGPIIKGVPAQKQNKRISNSLQTSKPLKKENTTNWNSTSDKQKTYGTVDDSNGVPLPGVNVKKENTTNRNSTSDKQKTYGTVVDSDGVSLVGVNVVIKGTNTGTFTDFDGNFTIDVSSSDVLQFSYVGFKNQDVQVGDSTSFNISMEIVAGKKSIKGV